VNKRNQHFVLLLLALAPAICCANSAVPGPLIYFGVWNTGLGVKWLVLSMFTCTLMEGVLFHIAHSFSRPYYASLLLNLASMVAGIPCAFAGAIVDFMIVATLLTIAVECYCALKMHNLRIVKGVKQSNTHTITSTIIANILSNIALLFLLTWMYHLYPPYRVFLRECFDNELKIRDAVHQYEEEHEGETNIAVTADNILPFLPDHKMPSCPFGGAYNVQSSVTNFHFCTHGRKNKPLKWAKKTMKSIGIGTPLAERPSHTTDRTDRVTSGSAAY